MSLKRECLRELTRVAEELDQAGEANFAEEVDKVAEELLDEEQSIKSAKKEWIIQSYDNSHGGYMDDQIFGDNKKKAEQEFKQLKSEGHKVRLVYQIPYEEVDSAQVKSAKKEGRKAAIARIDLLAEQLEAEGYSDLSKKMDQFTELQLKDKGVLGADEDESDLEAAKKLVKQLEEGGFEVTNRDQILNALFEPPAKRTAGIGDYSFNEAFNAAEKKLRESFASAETPQQKEAIMRAAHTELKRQYETATKKLKGVARVIGAMVEEVEGKIGESVEADVRSRADVDEVIEPIAFIKAVNRVLVNTL